MKSFVQHSKKIDYVIYLFILQMFVLVASIVVLNTSINVLYDSTNIVNDNILDLKQTNEALRTHYIQFVNDHLNKEITAEGFSNKKLLLASLTTSIVTGVVIGTLLVLIKS